MSECAGPTTMAPLELANGYRRIGITGHRDPRDPQACFQALSIALQKEGERGSPLALVGGLAAGCDALAALAALSLGVSTVALLPLHPLHYVNDFTTTWSTADGPFLSCLHEVWPQTGLQSALPSGPRELYDILFNASSICWHPPALEMEPLGSARDQGYALLGTWLCQNCDQIFACWNGTMNPLLGGTAWVVQQRQRANRSLYVIRTARHSDPV